MSVPLISALGTSLGASSGLLRSLRISYGDRSHKRALMALYREFVNDGDLAFDVGAHVGNRVAALRALGAKVVAVEPQPLMARVLRLFFGWRGVHVVQKAIAAEPGELSMLINTSNPTVSTLSDDFVRAAAKADGWKDEIWDASAKIEVTTLDALIRQFGRPRFIKIDVEGFELEALTGLSGRVDALSFEFVTMQRERAYACIDRCVELGFRQFNLSIGETVRLGEWSNADEMRDRLRTLSADENSGDIYAR
jgi:FkbM family methyltransferase